ncbi:MAG: hypothetical protein ACT4O2_12660 [Beijerinckiaceae bacterium]
MASDEAPLKHLDRMRVAAVTLDQDGFVIHMTETAKAIFDNDINVKDRRLFVRDPDAMALLEDAIDHFKMSRNPKRTTIIVPRQGKSPLFMGLWPSNGPAPAMVYILQRGRPWPLLPKHTQIA